MKPANFPGRKVLRLARMHARTAKVYVPPRAYDHGQAGNEAAANALLDQAEKQLGRQP